MTDLRNIERIYFVGIGGIGMSALAFYFAKGGYIVAGYDRSTGSITQSLAALGCEISNDDSVDAIPPAFRKAIYKDKILVVYTPAIPKTSLIMSYFRDNGYHLAKRAEVLGEISLHTDTIAVAGTHGKTTVSTMIAHLLKQSVIDCSAFLGGISKNYNSNLLLGESRFTVIEADEFDRSFHWLSPLMAVVTSLDADHLDIYGDKQTMIGAYNIFCAKVRKGGSLILNSRIVSDIVVPEGVTSFTYGMERPADFMAFNVGRREDHYTFSLRTPDKTIDDLYFSYPGIINIENMAAASAVALLSGVTEKELRKGVMLFQGVRRRFDIRINMPGLAYVDDYAHHPEEINACISSLKEFFRGRRITGIFQPHLYSRTRDHAEGFARILDSLDEVILLPVYPARELPIEGVTSKLIYDKMRSPGKRMLNKEDLPEKLNVAKLDVLVTIGAGDIDTLVTPIEDFLKMKRKG